MDRRIRKMVEYLNDLNLKDVAESMKHKTFVDNAQITQYLNSKCGRQLKSDNWTKILRIINSY